MRWSRFRLLLDPVRLRLDVERQPNSRGIVVATTASNNTAPTLAEI